jgi:hypothetical protein
VSYIKIKNTGKADSAHPYAYAVYGVGLQALDFWNRVFESRGGNGCSFLVFVVRYKSRGLCNELIPSSEEYYRMCNCAWSINLKPQRPRPQPVFCATKKKQNPLPDIPQPFRDFNAAYMIYTNITRNYPCAFKAVAYKRLQQQHIASICFQTRTQSDQSNNNYRLQKHWYFCKRLSVGLFMVLLSLHT